MPRDCSAYPINPSAASQKACSSSVSTSAAPAMSPEYTRSGAFSIAPKGENFNITASHAGINGSGINPPLNRSEIGVRIYRSPSAETV